MYDDFFARRTTRVSDSSLKGVLEIPPGVISFAGGLPDEQAFDLERIRDVAAAVAADRAAWQYSPTEGIPALRSKIAEFVGSMGIVAGPENVLITQGSQSALDLINMVMVDEGDRVLMEAPGYLGAISAAANYQCRLVPIPLEEDGFSIDALERLGAGAKYLYTVSTFQNPAGYTLSLEKRQRALEIAERLGFLIVEDGAYHHLRFEGEEIAPIKSFDRSGRVIYCGSFSKILTPGVRVGWIVADQKIVERIAMLKQATDLAGSSFSQLFVLRWLNEYGIEPPIALYRAKRDEADRSLRAHMPPGVTWNRAEGGFFFWVTLPSGMNAKVLLDAAKKRGVSFVPGYAFGGSDNAFRFSFSQVALDDIEIGVKRLADAIAQVGIQGQTTTGA